MKEKELTKLSDQELLEERKKTKSTQTMTAIILGTFVGIAVYSTVTKGLGFFTFFPLFFVLLIVNNRTNSKVLAKEIESRNLNKQ